MEVRKIFIKEILPLRKNAYTKAFSVFHEFIISLRDEAETGDGNHYLYDSPNDLLCALAEASLFADSAKSTIDRIYSEYIPTQDRELPNTAESIDLLYELCTAMNKDLVANAFTLQKGLKHGHK